MTLFFFRSNTTNILQTKPFLFTRAGQVHHPQVHPVIIQPPSSTSSTVALFTVLTARHVLRNFAVKARSFSVKFALSVRRPLSYPSISCMTLMGDVTYDLSKRGFPVRRRYVWSIKHHRRWARVPKKRRARMDYTHHTSEHPYVRLKTDFIPREGFWRLNIFRCFEGRGSCLTS